MDTSRKITALVVDDEDLARKVILEFLRDYPQIDVLAECGNGFDAVKAINELHPDLLFLDIQMPKLDGFEVLELVDTSRMALVFITAYDKYAMRAFEVHAIDYLLKPFSADRFKSALERALKRTSDSLPPASALAEEALPRGKYLERITAKDASRVFVIPLDKLDYIEAQDDYVSLKSEGKTFLKHQTISSLQSRLDPARFVRIHRSYLVNVDRVKKIEPYTKDSKVLILSDQTRLPVSRTGYVRLKRVLDGGVRS